MWFPLAAALTAPTSTSSSNTSIQLSSINTSTTSSSLAPPTTLSGSFIWLLKFVRQEINDWAAGLALELESYEARDPNNTRFQVLVLATIYILIAFHLEFYQWGKQELLDRQTPQPKRQRRGKRKKGDPTSKLIGNIRGVGYDNVSTSDPPTSPKPLALPNEPLHFFTPPSSPISTSEKKLVPETEDSLKPPRDSLSPKTLEILKDLKARRRIAIESSATTSLQDTTTTKDQSTNFEKKIESNGPLHLREDSHVGGQNHSESGTEAGSPSRVSYTISPTANQQPVDLDKNVFHQNDNRQEVTPSTKSPSPPRLSFASSAQDEHVHREKTLLRSRSSSPPRVSFASTAVKDEDGHHLDVGRRGRTSSPPRAGKTARTPRVSFSPPRDGKGHTILDQDDKDLHQQQQLEGKKEARASSMPRVSFSPPPKIRRQAMVPEEDLDFLELSSRDSTASSISFTSPPPPTNILRQPIDHQESSDDDLHRHSIDSDPLALRSNSRRVSFPPPSSNESLHLNDRSVASTVSTQQQEQNIYNSKDESGESGILKKVVRSHDGDRKMSPQQQERKQPLVCGESSIDDDFEEDDGKDSYGNKVCGIGQDSDELSLSKSEEDSFNESVRRRFGDLAFLDEEDQEVPGVNELEKIALALKAGLTYRNIKNRLKKKTYKDCFAGSAAVDFLSQHLHKPRAEALQIGRKIALEYNLFVKCGSKQKKKRKIKRSPATRRLEGDLDESTTNFDHSAGNLDQSVATLDQSMAHLLDQSAGNLDQSAASLYRSVPNLDQSAATHGGRSMATITEEGEGKLSSSLLLDSRRMYYRLFAFLPSEVDSMPMVRKMRIFEEGVDVKNRRRRRGLRIKKHKQSFSGKDAVNFLVRCRLCASREAAVDLCNEFIRQFNLFEPVKRIDDAFQDSGSSLYKFVDRKNRYFNIDDRFSTRLVEFQGNDFDWGSGDMTSDDGLDTTTMAHSRATYFDFDSSESESDSDLEEEDLHELRPGDYQRLCEVAEILERGVALKKQGTFVASRAVTFMVTSGLAESRKQAEVLGRRLEREFNLFYEVTGNHDFSDSNHFFKFTDKTERHSSPLKVQLPLDEIAEAFEQGVKVKDYVHNLKTYKQSFVGTKAVDFLVNSRLARNRVEAVRIGRQLVEHYNLFEPRIKGGREFCDDYVYFRFTLPENRKVPDFDEEELIYFRQSTLDRVKTAAEELQEITEWFLNGVKVKDNKFRAKYYRNTFVGTDAVSYMVNNSRAVSRKEAVELGRSLCSEVGLFKCIDGSTDFRDDYLLYRFEENFRHSLSEDQPGLSQGMVSGLEGISGVSAKSLSLEKIARAFRDNMHVAEHRGRRKIYENTFVGREAVDFLVGHGLAKDRVEAVGLGRAMAREFDLFEHIKNEHEFKDAKHHYRFCYEGDIRPLEVIELDKVRLSEIARAFIGNVKVKEHRKNLLVFKKTFVGSEAVDFLVRSYVASSRKEAVQIGRAITKEYNLFEHVTQDRKFEDSDALFYFQKADEQYKGLMFERQLARRNVFGSGWDYDLTSVCDSSAGLLSLDDDINNEVANDIALFKTKVQRVLQPHIEMIEDDDDSIEAFRKHYRNKFMAWASKFHRLDPRHQIQYFFESVAQDGARGIEDRDFSTDDMKSTRFFLPNRAHVFTVWRPTALHAIRKMMKGEGVGKGLDIKGKSAKRGKLSGFVPFLQIGDNKHKHKIRPPSKQGVVRVFYPSESRRARDIAADILERVGQEMIATVANAKKVLLDRGARKDSQKDALDTMLLDMLDPKILYVDDYAPQSYGLEVPERLFWEAFFTRQDCTRKPGSEYDTGRPSQPAFQDMNFATLRAQPKKGAPRACVFQHADPGEPMNPFELLMAYEEHGRVMPVVSDFDCFLVGTQSVEFSSPLAADQLDVLSWSVSEIENVLATSIAGDSWTVRWLEVLKKAAREGIHPEMPQFGFGDPKSYAIMKSAVSHLRDTGAVRHGAECFNYYFPQDLDDEYLVIANDLPGNKPWVYVDEAGLTTILSQRIDQGFTFPLNPKWILCDSNRWYELYQKLLLSPYTETQQSMNVWFPSDSGLREKIEKIHNRRPEGFYDEPIPMEEDGDVSICLSAKTGRKSVARSGKKDHLMSMFAMGLLEKPKESEAIEFKKSSSWKPSAIKRARKKVTKVLKGKGGRSRRSVAEPVDGGDTSTPQNGDDKNK